MSDYAEACMTINGGTISTGEAMTIRVAVAAFQDELIRDGLGEDEHGKAMRDAYLACCRSILKQMSMARAE